VRRGTLHHLELWRDDATATDGPWAWLLARLGYSRTDAWETGSTWSLDSSYVVLESGTDHVRGPADRLRSGMNHLALWAGSRGDVDALVAEAPDHGWRLLFPDRHPHAGGPQHYAAFLEDTAGFEVELVAEEPGARAD
jgi:catechol 2,3-dioxygenase-like lactoylglutathione lyase family enzyme